jgi:hypothetical protein
VRHLRRPFRDSASPLCSYGITGYPTMKIFRRGKVSNWENLPKYSDGEFADDDDDGDDDDDEHDLMMKKTMTMMMMRRMMMNMT